MKDFFTQCLKDLESLKGIRQLYYLQSDIEDGKRKLDVLINGMVATCKEFDYIPEAAQKTIIASQMRQDQDYEALNSRIIWKWLNAFKAPYLNPKDLQDKEVVFEPLSEETKKMIADHLFNLSSDIGKTILKDAKVEREMKQIQKEDKERVEKKSLSTHYKIDPETIALQKLRKEYAIEHTNLVTGRKNENAPSFDEWLNMEK